jgi:hypothetical protein
MTLPGDVHARLQRIEDEEGVNSVDFVIQAVSVWSWMNEDERRMTGIDIMQRVVRREMGGKARRSGSLPTLTSVTATASSRIVDRSHPSPR